MITIHGSDASKLQTRFPLVTLPIKGGIFEIEIAGGKLAALQPTQGRAEWLLFPPLANMHTHAERSFASALPPKSFSDALRVAADVRKTSSEADFQRRAEMLFSRALVHGTCRLRSHTDVDDLVEMRALNAVLAARQRFAGRLDVEIVAFANSRSDPADPEGRKRLLDALRQGADLIGASPNAASNPHRSIEAALDLARSERVTVDFHLDEHGESERSVLAFTVDAIARRGLEGRVAISHACALAMLPPRTAREIMHGLADVGAVVIVPPATNLYLQDRARSTPRRRGITLVKELMAAGVRVWTGSDNVRDSFYPYGDADPLEDAMLLSLAAHVDDPAQLVAAISAGGGDPTVGDRADLVLVRAGSLTEVLAQRPQERIVLRAGQAIKDFSACP